MKPRYKHDCEGCVYLSTWDDEHEETYDLYYCNQGSLPTVIARFGHDGPDYVSGIFFAPQVPALAEAKKLAQKKGLL